MAKCRDCKTLSGGHFVSEIYCEICGFGFIQQHGKFLDVTCLRSHGHKSVPIGQPIPDPLEVVDDSPVRRSPPSVHKPTPVHAVVASTTSAASATSVSSPSSSSVGAPAASQSTGDTGEIDQGLLETIRKHGPAGKAAILSHYPVAEALWMGKIRALLAAKLVLQEGEKRGTKYKAV